MKNVLILITCISLVALSCKKGSSAKVPMKNTQDSFSYAFGIYVGGFLHNSDIKKVDWNLFKDAVERVMAKGDSGMVFDQKKVMEIIQDYAAESKFAKNKKAGADYIAKHKGDGFTVTKTGLMFKELKKGNGVKPNITDTVLLHYTGKFVDGKPFESNEGQDAAKFPMNGSIPGFQEALEMMSEGSEAEVIIPYNLAYGKEGSRDMYGNLRMEPYQTLIFILRMEKIQR